MPSPSLTPREALEHLDARHDELIRKLDELNAQIETALAEFATRRNSDDEAVGPRPNDARRSTRKAA
jgi:hypothetical protein